MMLSFHTAFFLARSSATRVFGGRSARASLKLDEPLSRYGAARRSGMVSMPSAGAARGSKGKQENERLSAALRVS